MFGFYEELLSTRFPHNQYRLVFVDGIYQDITSYAGLTLCSVNLLHPNTIIDQVMTSRRAIALAIAEQYFECYLLPQSWYVHIHVHVKYMYILYTRACIVHVHVHLSAYMYTLTKHYLYMSSFTMYIVKCSHVHVHVHTFLGYAFRNGNNYSKILYFQSAWLPCFVQ